MRILHLASLADWRQAVESGDYRTSTRDQDLDAAGFLHASVLSQLPGVIERFYADADLAEFTILVVDVPTCEKLGSPVRWDAVGDTWFPHIYGTLPAGAVVATLALSSGRFVMPDLGGLAVAADPLPPPA